MAHLYCSRGLQPDNRTSGMGEVEISKDGMRYPLVDFQLGAALRDIEPAPPVPDNSWMTTYRKSEPDRKSARVIS
jgi:hypothetical protein